MPHVIWLFQLQFVLQNTARSLERKTKKTHVPAEFHIGIYISLLFTSTAWSTVTMSFSRVPKW